MVDDAVGVEIVGGRRVVIARTHWRRPFSFLTSRRHNSRGAAAELPAGQPASRQNSIAHLMDASLETHYISSRAGKSSGASRELPLESVRGGPFGAHSKVGAE